ncbi:amidohydrolase [Aquabacterium sp. J223]|uniref:amidohydrolase family protein n=1 Tax=Aquabacterium sp. J223 TaxID=2898431 RepID=UPI0021AD5396|nr:amidohydrolase family protein [Aquabacterium sp. J223]UUX93982.1 amidohydrolase family protein [Aquabacterium sp. J223]
MDHVDCHFHVIAPVDRFPMHPARSYTPAAASLAAWRATLGPLGITHGVVVQPSVYGTDHRVLLAALAEGRGRLVGVAAVDAGVTDAELDRLAQAGVRGVRMAHFEPGDPRARGGFVPLGAFDALEPRLAERGLHLQLFTDSRLLPPLAGRLARSRVPVVIDHMGRTPARLGADHEGLRTLCRLLHDAPLWVKLSGAANVSDAGPDYADVRPIHEALVDAAPDRLLWGSDWPHTKPAGPRPDTASLWRQFIEWTPPPLRDPIASVNAMGLYRFPIAIDRGSPGARPDPDPDRNEETRP